MRTPKMPQLQKADDKRMRTLWCLINGGRLGLYRPKSKNWLTEGKLIFKKLIKLPTIQHHPRLLGTKEYVPYIRCIRCHISYTFPICRKAGYMANMAVVVAPGEGGVLPYMKNWRDVLPLRVSFSTSGSPSQGIFYDILKK